MECGEWRLAGKECKERGDKVKLEYVLFLVYILLLKFLFIYRLVS